MYGCGKGEHIMVISMKKQRRNIVEVAYRARQGHLSSSMSVLELLNVLYKEVMNFDPTKPDDKMNDCLILSKGHAALAQYAVLLDLGCITEKEFFSYSKFDSILGEHPDRNKVPGVCVSTGSLGHGFPNAVGLAAGFAAQNMPNRTYVVIGDGEANEGSIWEAAAAAALLQLHRLTCIADDNQSASHMPELGAKFASFGWDVVEIDGNDLEQVRHALERPHTKPLFVWAHTVKGYGCRLMERDPEGWHHRIVTDSEYQELMEELQ